MTTYHHIRRIAARAFRPVPFSAFRPALLGLAVLCLVSCGGGTNIFDPLNVDDKEEVYKPVVGEPGEVGVVSIHEIVRYKRGNDSEYEIGSMFEDEVVIDKNQLLDSSDIISIEAIAINDLPGFYKLRLHLTQAGGKNWRKLSLEGRDKSPSLAFVIDNVLYRTFKPRFLYSNEDTVVVDGPFDEAAALNLEANAIRNFMYFSQQ
jgi:hypothetical protein